MKVSGVSTKNFIGKKGVYEKFCTLVKGLSPPPKKKVTIRKGSVKNISSSLLRTKIF